MLVNDITRTETATATESERRSESHDGTAADLPAIFEVELKFLDLLLL